MGKLRWVWYHFINVPLEVFSLSCINLSSQHARMEPAYNFLCRNISDLVWLPLFLLPNWFIRSHCANFTSLSDTECWTNWCSSYSLFFFFNLNTKLPLCFRTPLMFWCQFLNIKKHLIRCRRILYPSISNNQCSTNTVGGYFSWECLSWIFHSHLLHI